MKKLKPLMLVGERVKNENDDTDDINQSIEVDSDQEIILDIDNKIIYIDGLIKVDTYRLFNTCVTELKNEYGNNLEEITIEINSEGGSIDSSYGIIETMNKLKQEGIIVKTNAREWVMSGGCAVFINGSKGYRNVRLYSMLMFHGATYQDQAVNFARLEMCKKWLGSAWNSLEKTLQKCTKLSQKEINKIKCNPLDTYLDCYEAVEKGFADNILE